MPEPEIKARFSINVLENRRNEVLLLKRSEHTNYGPGKWGFPAGHIEENESPEDCSVRELQEEIGKQHSVRLVKPFGPVRDTFYGGVYQIYLYHYLWENGEVILNHEHTDYAWVNREEFKNYRVMDGIDEDLLYLDIWPREFLNEAKLPG